MSANSGRSGAVVRFAPPPWAAGQGRARHWFWPAVMFAAAVLALQIDMPLAQRCLKQEYPRIVRQLLDTIEPFGNGLGVALIMLAVWVNGRELRAQIPRVLSIAFGAGLVVDCLKLVVSRTRPHSFDFRTGGALSTFGGWFDLATTDSHLQSFPSGHAATAVGFAIGLSWLFPRGWWLFAALATCVCAQRVQVAAHYPSDVLAAAAVGWLVALAFFRLPSLARYFDRLEERLAAEWNSPQDATPALSNVPPAEGSEAVRASHASHVTHVPNASHALHAAPVTHAARTPRATQHRQTRPADAR